MLQTELLRLVLAMAAGAIAGAVAGNIAAGTSIALTGLLAWHGWQPARLFRVLNEPAGNQHDGAGGVWRALTE